MLYQSGLEKWATELLINKKGYSKWDTGGGCWLLASPEGQHVVFSENISGAQTTLSLIFTITDDSGASFSPQLPIENLLVGLALYHHESEQSLPLAVREFGSVNINNLAAFESSLHSLSIIKEFKIEDVFLDRFEPTDDFIEDEAPYRDEFFEKSNLIDRLTAAPSSNI